MLTLGIILVFCLIFTTYKIVKKSKNIRKRMKI